MNQYKQKEASLVEMKAKVDSLKLFQQKLQELSAKYVGTFHQIDTYYEVPQGRLKLRETDGESKAQLVYYERPDVQGLKQSQVFIVELSKPGFMKEFLGKVLRTKAVVDKQRAIYRLKGTQVHLDTVKNLGTYIEFERHTENMLEVTRKAYETLETLMQILGVKQETLQKGSYCDIIMRQAT